MVHPVKEFEEEVEKLRPIIREFITEIHQFMFVATLFTVFFTIVVVLIAVDILNLYP